MSKGLMYALIILVVFALAGFYWFSVRPENIRRECFRQVTNKSGDGFDVDSFLYEKYGTLREDSYNNCLRSKGLEIK